MREIVSVTNLTNPGVDPVDGDMVRIEYSDGTSAERVYNSVEQVIPETPIRVITVAAFLDRMDLGIGKLAELYSMIDAGRNAGDYTLFSAMENLKRREYIDMDDPRLRPQLEAIPGLYTSEQLDTIFVDGTQDEEPETV